MLSASLTSPTQAVVRNERQARLAEALASFPAEHRELLRLRYGEGLPTKDVATRIGKSEVATRVLLSRLVHRLQELLGPAEGPLQQFRLGIIRKFACNTSNPPSLRKVDR